MLGFSWLHTSRRCPFRGPRPCGWTPKQTTKKRYPAVSVADGLGFVALGDWYDLASSMQRGAAARAELVLYAVGWADLVLLAPGGARWSPST